MWKLVRTTTVAALLLLVAAPLAAAPFGLSDEAAEEILGSLAERYEVIATRHGYVLRPREETSFALIEVEEKTVLLDGTALPPETLAERLGDEDAALVLTLAGERDVGELLPEERRRREEQLAAELEAEARGQEGREPEGRETDREERRTPQRGHSGSR